MSVIFSLFEMHEVMDPLISPSTMGTNPVRSYCPLTSPVYKRQQNKTKKTKPCVLNNASVCGVFPGEQLCCVCLRRS